MGYEFEDAQNDENAAKATIGGLAVALVGWGIKKYLNSQKEQQQVANNQQQIMREQINVQIRQCESRMNTINGKFFPSESERAEARRLAREIQELKKRL